MTSEQLRNQKNQLRKHCRQINVQRNKDFAKNASQTICDRVKNSFVFSRAKNVLMFCPTEGEVDIMSMLDQSLAQGKKVYFPKCSKDGILEFYRVDSKANLECGMYKIYEPQGVTEKFENEENTVTLCLVPSVCLDKRGYRLGRGKGYYDRFVKANKEIIYCAVQFDELVLDEIIYDKRHDKKVDIIFTEMGETVVGAQKE